MIGLILGTLLGLCELFPNAHPQVLALILLPLLPLGTFDLCMFAISLLVTSMHMHALTHTYHPIPRKMLDHAEPAQTLAYQGLGKLAVGIQCSAIPYGLVTAMVLTPIMAKAIHTIKFLVIPAGILLLFLSIFRAKHKLGALLVLGMAIAIGMLAQNKLHHDAMAPLLTGLFTMPPLLHILVQDNPLRLPDDEELPTPPGFSLLDSILGSLAAFMPGISTSSMAHLTSAPDEEPQDYLARTSVQGAASQAAALILLLLLNQQHSTAAVGLKQVMPVIPSTYAAWAMGIAALLFLVPLNQMLTAKLEPFYKRTMTRIKPKPLAILMAPVAISIACAHAGWYALIIMAGAAGVSLLQKQMHAPNQVLLQALTVPILLTMA